MESASKDDLLGFKALYSQLQPRISEICDIFKSSIAHFDELLENAKREKPDIRAPKARRLKGVSKQEAEEPQKSISPVKEEVEAPRKSRSPLRLSPSNSEKENRVPSAEEAITQAETSRPGEATEGTNVSDAIKTPKKISACTPRQARGMLQPVTLSTAKRTEKKKPALFSPYGKFSIQEKAKAFEQGVPLSVAKAIPEGHRSPVVRLVQCKVTSPIHLQLGHAELPTPNPSATGSQEATVPLKNGVTEEMEDTSSQTSSVKEEKSTLKKKQQRARAASTKATSAKKVTSFQKKLRARSRSSSFTVTPLAQGAKKAMPSSPIQGNKISSVPYRLGMKPVPTSQVKQAPAAPVQKESADSQERSKERKMERMKLKAEETKKKRESRAARVRATRKQQEEKMMLEQQEREQREQLKQQERQKKRKAFHQRTQSEREKEIAGLSNPVKRKGNSISTSTTKKIHLEAVKVKATAEVDNSLAASRLLFFEPTTCLSNKVKLNNSLQQQAMLNNLSMSLRSEQPSYQIPGNANSAQEKSEVQIEQAQPALNATYIAEPEHDATYTVESKHDATSTAEHLNSAVWKTPVASGTPASTANSYDITPHHSELPPEPNADPDNYDIQDFKSDDDTDDEDEPRKVVPNWAKGQKFRQYIDKQYSSEWVGGDVFGSLVDINLSTVFPIKKKYFNKRTSSAIWTSPVARPSQ